MSARRAAPSRKRATPGAAPAAARVRAQREPGLDTLAQSLELGGDDDAEVEEEGEEEPFPELDAGDDDEDEEEDEDEDEAEDDDDDAGSGSGSGSGFDSDEIDDWDEAKDERTLSSFLTQCMATWTRRPATSRTPRRATRRSRA